MKIGFLGPEKSFTWEAAVRSLAGEYIAIDTISNIFEGVEKGHIDLGVVPI